MVALKSHFMYSILDLLNLKYFASKVCLYNFDFWSTPFYHIIHEVHATSDTTLYVSHLFHHQNKKNKSSMATIDVVLY
jgi:hypothetical protein